MGRKKNNKIYTLFFHNKAYFNETCAVTNSLKNEVDSTTAVNSVLGSC